MEGSFLKVLQPNPETFITKFTEIAVNLIQNHNKWQIGTVNVVNKYN